MNKTTLTFPSHDLWCEADLYFPDEEERPPVVIMGHGFGAERNFGTASTIRAFVDLGLAVFIFDYRYFGGSQGEPRQLIGSEISLQDWQSALAFVRNLEAVDGDRIAIWGSSFGGGHVLVTAATDHAIRAVIAQVPHCDSRSLVKNTPLLKSLRALGHALLDKLLSLVGLCHRVPIIGNPGEGFAALDFPGWKSQYLRLANQSKSWHNAMPARSLLKIANYNPVDTVDAIRCPVLILNGEFDGGIPREDVLRTVKAIKTCRHIEYPVDHFDLYDGWDYNDSAVAEQCRFLSEILLAR